MLPPGNAPGTVSLQACYCGPQADAERALAPIRKLGTPTRDSIKAMDYVQVQRINDSTDTRSIASYLRAGSSARCRAISSRRSSTASTAIRVA